MELGNDSTIFQVLFFYYRDHNIDIKEIQSTNCSGGMQWVWLQFGECLLRPFHIFGYWIGLLALPLWIVGSLWYHHTLSKNASSRFLGYVTLTFVIDIISFVGSVLTMQVLLLIIFGLTTITIDFVSFATFVITRKSHSTPRYREIYNNYDTKPKSDKGVSYPRRCCHLGCLLLICGTLSLLLLALTHRFGILSLPVTHTLSSTSSVQNVHASDATRVYVTQVLYVVGYVLGYVTCICHVGVNAPGGRFSTRNQDLVEGRCFPMCKEAMLITFDLLFIISVLLQSGGLRLALSALPWLSQRLIHSSFMIFLIDDMKRMKPFKMFDDNDRDDNNIADDEECDDILFDKEDKHLLKRPEKRESWTSVTVDMKYPATTGPSHFTRRTCTDKPMSLWPAPELRSRARICSFETGSTSESDDSSMSQLRDIELYRDRRCSIPRIIVHPCDSHPSVTSRPSRLSLHGLRMSSLNDASPESHDQRVRSWVSQHTPEEEAVSPPSLALSLNLDSTTPLSSPTSPCIDLDPEFSHLLPQYPQFASGGEYGGHCNKSEFPRIYNLHGFNGFHSCRIGHTLGVMSMMPRKNSL